MSERSLVRKEDKDPIKFAISGAPKVTWTRCGKKCNPQLYRPSGQHFHFCKRSHNKKCHID